MQPTRPTDLLTLAQGEAVSKRDLYDLVQYSKVEGSPHWDGEEWTIGNTPQQGINWIGLPPETKAVVIKTKPGSYDEDGWSDDSKTHFNYSFKARKGAINYSELANAVLIQQPQHLYPVLLFVEHGNDWRFEGRFSVSEIQDRHVVLAKGELPEGRLACPQEEAQYCEGGRRYVTHLMMERSRGVISMLKATRRWSCEICRRDFRQKYGVDYIEAHHKTALATYSSTHVVNPKDFALLCPNCHRAVHIHMKTWDSSYVEIADALRSTIQMSDRSQEH